MIKIPFTYRPATPSENLTGWEAFTGAWELAHIGHESQFLNFQEFFEIAVKDTLLKLKLYKLTFKEIIL